VSPAHATPRAEAFYAVVWHILVSHRVRRSEWESVR
jgi:hypothetical protein